MSKASEWAQALANEPEAFTRGRLVFAVSDKGDLQVSYPCETPKHVLFNGQPCGAPVSAAGTETLCCMYALELARWILDTFGENEHE